MKRATEKITPNAETSARAAVGSGQGRAEFHPLLRLQNAIGNQAATGILQHSLPGHTADANEQQADRIADDFAKTAHSTPRNACSCGGDCPKCKTHQQTHTAEEHLQAKPIGSGGLAQTVTPPIVNDALSTPGQPLDRTMRALMDSHFGQDFSQVRVHTDERAAESARAIHARAYTVGRDIVFADGKFSSTTDKGTRLLAHELAHVVQQSGGETAIQRDDDDDEPVAETRPEPPSLYISASDPILCGGQPCITDEDISRPLNEATERIDREIAREREISKTPLDARFQQALYKMSKETYSIDEEALSSRLNSGLLVQAPDELWTWGVAHDLFLPSEEKWVRADAEQQIKRTYKKRLESATFGTYRKDLSEPSTGEEVWYSGRNNDLFLPSEKERVIEDREKYLEAREGRKRKAREAEKRNFEIQQYRNWVAQGEQLRSPAPIIQPFAFAALGPLVAAAYGGTLTGAMVGETYNACTEGTAGDCATAAAHVAAAVVVHRTTKKLGESPIDPPKVAKGVPSEPTVWVQYKDGRILEFQKSEVQGNLQVGAKVSTKGEGKGRVVSLGDPPHSSKVLHEPLKPLITDEELNQPIPMRSGLTGARRQLTSDELKGAKEIREAFDDVRMGDPNAMNVLAKYRPKELTGDLAGWWEVDLLPGNPGALNQMRILFRIGKDGQLETVIRQMH